MAGNKHKGLYYKRKGRKDAKGILPAFASLLPLRPLRLKNSVSSCLCVQEQKNLLVTISLCVFASFALKTLCLRVSVFKNIENQHLTINLRVFASSRLYNHLIPALMLVSDCERIAAFLFNLETQ